MQSGWERFPLSDPKNEIQCNLFTQTLQYLLAQHGYKFN